MPSPEAIILTNGLMTDCLINFVSLYLYNCPYLRMFIYENFGRSAMPMIHMHI